MFCEKCGEKVVEGIRFCSKCGNPVKPKQEVVQTAEERLPIGLYIFSMIFTFIIPAVIGLLEYILYYGLGYYISAGTLITIDNVIIIIFRIIGFILGIVSLVKAKGNKLAKGVGLIVIIYNVILIIEYLISLLISFRY